MENYIKESNTALIKTLLDQAKGTKNMEDVSRFRIVESALYGFYIQYKQKQTIFNEEKNVLRSFLGYKPLVNIEEKEYWSEYFHPAMKLNDKGQLTNAFPTKQEAIDFIKKVCTPDNFYYPESWKQQ